MRKQQSLPTAERFAIPTKVPSSITDCVWVHVRLELAIRFRHVIPVLLIRHTLRYA
jgi:hypothetical protein